MSELPALVSMLAMCGDPVGVAVHDATIVLVNKAVATLAGMPQNEDNIAPYLSGQDRVRLAQLCRFISDPDLGFEGPLATRIVVQVDESDPVELWVSAASAILYEASADEQHTSATLLRFRSAVSSPRSVPSQTANAISLETLRPTEVEVLKRTLKGDRVHTIADQMFLSEHTVRNTLKKINRKLGVGSTAELRERLGTRAHERLVRPSTTSVGSTGSTLEVLQVS
jgi:DNA-binding CsgD family transcriptional regulator